MSKTARSCRA